MPVNKLQLLFKLDNAVKDTGWSETYFIDTSFPPGPSFFTGDRYVNLVAARLNCLAAFITFTGARATTVAPGRPPVQPSSSAVAVWGGQPKTTPAYNTRLNALTSDFAGTAVVLGSYTVPTNGIVYRKRQFLSGAPDSATHQEDARPDAGDYMTALTALRLYIGDQNNGVVIRSNDRSAANPKLVVTAYDPATGTLTVPGHALVTGTVVDALGWRGGHTSVLPRGSYRVQVTDADHLKLAGAATFTGILKIGYLRPQFWLHIPIFSAPLGGYATKKRGAPTIRSRGRRRTAAFQRA